MNAVTLGAAKAYINSFIPNSETVSLILTPGAIDTSTGAINTDGNNTPKKRYVYDLQVNEGDIITISDPSFYFTVRDFHNTGFPILKATSADPFIVTSSAVVGINVRRSDNGNFTAGDLAILALSHTKRLGKIDKKAGLVTENIRFNVNVNSTVPLNSATTTANSDTETLVSTRCVLRLADDYDPHGIPSPLIMLGHGLSGHVQDASWYGNGTDFLALVDYFAAQGYCVFDVDNTEGVTGNVYDFGCPQLINAYYKAYKYIVDKYNVEDKIFVYAVSMGTFSAFNFCKIYPGIVKKMAISGARASLSYWFGLGSPSAAKIATKYGFADTSGSTWEADKVAGYDPYNDIVTIGATPYILYQYPPIKWLYSDADTTNATEAAALLAAMRNGGNYIRSRNLTGLTHDQVCYLPYDGMRDEVRMWFDRSA